MGNDPLFELMSILEKLSGVQLKAEKRFMVESRLTRRVRSLGLESMDDYIKYFHGHRDEEIPHALSLITTHTTEFFREDGHFNSLFDQIFPKIFSKQNNICIWSAACSTGPEVYSLAIALLEYLRLNPDVAKSAASMPIYGTDIDSISVQVAKEGVYPLEQVKHLSPALVDRYFERGTGPLASFVRVKEHVHRMCQFKVLNLLDDHFLGAKADIIFLRNVVIYFKPADIEAIVTRLQKTIAHEGYLFLGHSESLAGLETPFKKVGNSIYSLASKKNKTDLIVIGASTGGVEALEVVLKEFPLGCPPILIVQHIPENFSKTFADRLNEICRIRVSEASSGERLEESHAYIAPGGKQMKVLQKGDGFFIEVNDDPPLGVYKPSVDYLFKSVLPFAKEKTISAALLTGMGSDGARTLRDLRMADVYTVVQNKKTSVVFGMPGKAVELEAAVDVVPLTSITSKLLTGHLKRKAA